MRLIFILVFASIQLSCMLTNPDVNLSESSVKGGDLTRWLTCWNGSSLNFENAYKRIRDYAPAQIKQIASQNNCRDGSHQSSLGANSCFYALSCITSLDTNGNFLQPHTIHEILVKRGKNTPTGYFTYKSSDGNYTRVVDLVNSFQPINGKVVSCTMTSNNDSVSGESTYQCDQAPYAEYLIGEGATIVFAALSGYAIYSIPALALSFTSGGTVASSVGKIANDGGKTEQKISSEVQALGQSLNSAVKEIGTAATKVDQYRDFGFDITRLQVQSTTIRFTTFSGNVKSISYNLIMSNGKPLSFTLNRFASGPNPNSWVLNNGVIYGDDLIDLGKSGSGIMQNMHWEILDRILPIINTLKDNQHIVNDIAQKSHFSPTDIMQGLQGVVTVLYK